MAKATPLDDDAVNGDANFICGMCRVRHPVVFAADKDGNWSNTD